LKSLKTMRPKLYARKYREGPVRKKSNKYQTKGEMPYFIGTKEVSCSIQKKKGDEGFKEHGLTALQRGGGLRGRKLVKHISTG